ncbi:MAG: DUF3048 domain-containing protein [Clostridia bacterium]|nr:DUF3048 domain-containing protein [Clostridia bacterium]
MSPRWIGPAVLVLALAGLLAGAWWLAPLAAFAAGVAGRPGGRPSLDAALGTLAAWALADAWRIALGRGAEVAEFAVALAGLPAGAAVAFFALPALLAAGAAACAVALGASIRAAFAHRPAGRPRAGGPASLGLGLALVLTVATSTLAGCGGPGAQPATPSEAVASESEAAWPSEAGSEAPPSEAAPSEAEASGDVLPVPFAAIVDNQSAARPQSGLLGARIVVEALAEGGITRYFAVFDRDPGEALGPIRSTRIYFNRLSHLWRLPLAHAGGNQDALADFKGYRAYDVDGIFTDGAAFFRVSGRKAPHNLYTDAAHIERALSGRDVAPRLPEYRVAAAPDAEDSGGVRITYGAGATEFVVEWRPALDGRWARFADGRPDEDAGGGQLEAANVLVVVAPHRPDDDPFTPGSIDVDWSHPGPGWLFRNGQVVPVRWAFTDSAIVLSDEAGRAVGFTAGNLWIEVVPDAGRVEALPTASR